MNKGKKMFKIDDLTVQHFGNMNKAMNSGKFSVSLNRQPAI